MRALLAEDKPAAARFFRSPAGFEALARALRGPRALKTQDVFRAWVPSGSLGEDAYSTAIVLLEALGARAPGRRLRVFATSPDAGDVRKARRGFYDASALAQLSPRRHRRFLLREGRGYRVAQELRQLCVFATHDLSENIPLIRLDLIYCPRPLSGMPEAARARLLDLFHFALKPEGLLLLADSGAAPRADSFKRCGGSPSVPLYARVGPVAGDAGQRLQHILGHAAKALRSQWVDDAQRTEGSAEARRRQDEFVAMVSHELRTPLTAIMGFTQTLKNGVEDPRRQRMFLNTVEKNAQRLLTLVDGLLDVADSRARRPRPVEVRRSLALACGAFRAQARAAGVTIRLDADPGLRVVADPADLPSIFENLIGNAVKYNRRGGKVLVRAARDDGRVVVSVADTGSGIPPESCARVFDRFFRCPSNGQVKGSGLGLAIVRGRVEANGGGVRVESVPGRGSTFSIWLPGV